MLEASNHLDLSSLNLSMNSYYPFPSSHVTPPHTLSSERLSPDFLDQLGSKLAPFVRLPTLTLEHFSTPSLTPILASPHPWRTSVVELSLKWCFHLRDPALDKYSSSSSPSPSPHFVRLSEFTHLRRLMLNGCSEISDRGVEWISIACSQLEELRLSRCSKVTNKGVISLQKLRQVSPIDSSVRRLTWQLTSLYLVDLYQLTDRAFAQISALSQLQVLSVAECYKLTSMSMHYVALCPDLLALNFSQCSKLAPDGTLLSPLSLDSMR